MECIVNVVGAESYKAAVLQVKNKIEKSKVDPTKQVTPLFLACLFVKLLVHLSPAGFEPGSL